MRGNDQSRVTGMSLDSNTYCFFMLEIFKLISSRSLKKTV